MAEATAEVSCKSSLGIRIGFVTGLIFLGSFARIGAWVGDSTNVTTVGDGTGFAVVLRRLGGFEARGEDAVATSESERFADLGVGGDFAAFALAAEAAAAAAALSAFTCSIFSFSRRSRSSLSAFSLVALSSAAFCSAAAFSLVAL